MAAELSSDLVVDTCDRGHKFGALEHNHPRRDGVKRCPHCMAIGLDTYQEMDLFHEPPTINRKDPGPPA